MYKLMKIKKLKNYGIPSYIINIWERHYSPYLLPLQEEAVRNYGILNGNDNLLIIAPTSSGKSFIGEMAALSLVRLYIVLIIVSNAGWEGKKGF